MINSSYAETRRRGPLQYLRNKLPCFTSKDSIDDLGFTDPEVSVIRELDDNLSDINSDINNDTRNDVGSSRKDSNRISSSLCPPCECLFEPSSRSEYWWNFIVCLAVLYNYWVMIFRYSFSEITPETAVIWLSLDYSVDAIYLLDILRGFRTAYLENGVLQKRSDKIRTHYKNTSMFYYDCACLLPLDFIYLSIGYNSLLRAFRLLKILKFWKFLDITERHTNFPNLTRTVAMLHYLFLFFHWNACILYVIMKDSSAFNNDNFQHSTASGMFSMFR